jgi:hypothetical protein
MGVLCVLWPFNPSRKPLIQSPLQVGKYLVSPLTRQLPDGRYAASVSIRSGRGTHTHDRVLRLVPLFDSIGAAAHYALNEGLAWLDQMQPSRHQEPSCQSPS